MVKRLWFSALFLIAGVLLSGCGKAESQLAAICEDLIKERLKAPSDYQRVKLVEWTDAGKLVAGLSYDAPNDYGTPMRGAGICEYDGTDETGMRRSQVRLDGETEFQWFARLKRETESK